jgi:aryl-alcohol dehydrogenase-like predicted oxidoreductase
VVARARTEHFAEIPGASSIDHLLENLAASGVQLDAGAVDRLYAM